MSAPATQQDRPVPINAEKRSVDSRLRKDKLFVALCIAVALMSVGILALLLVAILVRGIPYFSWSFLTGINGSEAGSAGILPALLGTLWVCFVCAAFTLPIGIGTAIFLEEFKPRHPITRFFHSVIQLNINNLAGVPSVVYGIIGLTAFVAMFGLSAREQPTPTDETVAASAGDEAANAEGEEAPVFEFGATYYDQFGVADSNRLQNVLFPVERRLAPPVSVEDGMKCVVDGGEETIRLVGPWEALPNNENTKTATIRLGSTPERVEIEGEYFDEFESFAGTKLRVPVAGEDAPPTKVAPPLKALNEDGQSLHVRVLSSSQVPTLEFPLPEEGDDPLFERVEVDGKHYDQLTTGDDYVLRVAVTSNDAPLPQPKQGLTLSASTEWGLPVRIVFTDTPRPGANKGKFDQILRSAPEPDRIRRDAWYCFRMPLGSSVLAGGLTLMLVILPVIIIASQESLRAVPDSLREGALGMGATQWQVVRNVTLPAAMPGIMTGSILAMSRAIGEAAPLLIVSGVVFINYLPSNLMSKFTVMPLQIYSWAKEPNDEFQKVAATGIIVLLTVLLSFNAFAVFVRQKTQRPMS